MFFLEKRFHTEGQLPRFRQLGFPYLSCLLLCCLLWGCKNPGEKPLVVLGASSATDLLLTVAKNFEKEFEIEIQASFAASSTLARQIVEGAEFDFFISADPQWISHIHNKRPGMYRDRPFLFNRMVLISHDPGEHVDSLNQLRKAKGLIALGNPDHVPAGRYARESFELLGLWDELKPRMVPTANVREALRLVLAGECEYAIVYQSDAKLVGKKAVILPLPQGTQVGYQIMWHNGRNSARQELFLESLFSEKTMAISKEMGFEWHPPEETMD